MPPTPEQMNVLRQATEDMERAEDAVRENREEQMDDQRFRAGDQWAEKVKLEREQDGRPCLTFNRLPQFVRQITGETRINKPAIKVRPAGGGADKERAEILEGLIRAIEAESFAHAVYASAQDNAAGCGEGHWQIVTKFVDDDIFDQEILLERIANPFAVLWDPDSTDQTRRDARYCFVLSEMSVESFKKQYPDSMPADFSHERPYEGLKHWRNGNNIVIADYWVKEKTTRLIVEMADGATHDLTSLRDNEGEPLDEEVLSEIRNKGVKEREVESFKVVKYQLSGVEVLEGPEEWAGRFIPVFTVYGEEVHVGRKTITHGLVRYAKDPQRAYNFMRSAAVEAIALAPKAPFIGTIKQFGGAVERFWKNANKKNYAFLPFNPDANAPGAPQRQAPPDIQLAFAQEAQLSAADMNATTGIYQPALGDTQPGNPSGLLQQNQVQESDVGTFVYQDNLAIAMTATGKALVDLIPRIYDATRSVQILNEDDTTRDVDLNQVQEFQDPDDGQTKQVIMNDLSVGKYSVRVMTGPSFTTRRREAANGMLEFMRTNPEGASVVMDLFAKNLDWPGADEIAERFRKIAIARKFAEPEEGEETGEPDPQAVAEAKKTEAEAEKATLDTQKIAAQISEIEAKTDAQQLENVAAGIQLSIQQGELRGVIQQVVLGIVQQLATEAQPLDQTGQTGLLPPNGGL